MHAHMQVEKHQEERKIFAVTPMLRNAPPPSLNTIISGVVQPDPLTLEEKLRLHWLTTFLLQAPATFFISSAYKEKIDHDFATVPWSYLERAVSGDGAINGCQLPRGVNVSCVEMNLAWDFVARSGIQRVRVRPCQPPAREQMWKEEANDEAGSASMLAAFAVGTPVDDTIGSSSLQALSECVWEVESIQTLLDEFRCVLESICTRQWMWDVLDH